ncbi:hypothetical protein H0B56_21920 [Haloechinothrix sp. YIM 98757]|uniref:Rho termination factor, N-terminal domain n=1 Tax=Haloechinothrix aidingensis TaxID=2752311 RepID=A0A838AG95_9PSEU|nr:hypothetical protein [Haloechinothrix aidingensis]MBA0128211.1 hypothetical protein [Haloechinothrix aidingensis]
MRTYENPGELDQAELAERAHDVGIDDTAHLNPQELVEAVRQQEPDGQDGAERPLSAT